MTDMTSLDAKLAKLVAGNCGVLALEIHRLTGWQIVALCDSATEVSVFDQTMRRLATCRGR
ncbi:hypothetical protein [Sphingobium yanoikuyae]|uniref:hypothetical protein n=1 Tax=Sphingobium yanoikuyae TaxID=13690 RepID=UPI0022DE3B64|nr:hypothetical protein [Sphingobium yanoikuyae]WBQ19120.1 hypothetical protein PAE53_25175 [Sphingobium yanoikuyae]